MCLCRLTEIRFKKNREERHTSKQHEKNVTFSSKCLQLSRKESAHCFDNFLFPRVDCACFGWHLETNWRKPHKELFAYCSSKINWVIYVNIHLIRLNSLINLIINCIGVKTQDNDILKYALWVPCLSFSSWL